MTEGATTRITRRRLYERVWAESVAHIAPDLGLWPTRLSKLCVKNNIPVPGRAYWYYSNADRKTMWDPLPDADRDWEITITPAHPGPPKPAADAPEIPRIVVPDRLTRPHRLVREAKSAETSSCCEHGRLRLPGGCLNILVSEACRKRAFCIMDTVIKACEARGWVVHAPETHRPGTIVDVQGCKVRVTLVEGLRQEPRELDQWEKKLDAESQRKRRRQPYKLAPNGRLGLKIECVDYWHSAQWHDGANAKPKV